MANKIDVVNDVANKSINQGDLRIANQCEPMSKPLKYSHCFARAFQPDKLRPPRAFTRPVLPHSKRKLVLEIGAGKGKHAIEYAKLNPDEVLIAIERTQGKYQAFAKEVHKIRQAGEKLENLTPIHADAIPYVTYAIPPNCLDSVYLLYPNPEPHNPNQRWLNMPFFEFLLSRVKDGGQIILVSNIAEYMQEAKHQAEAIWRLPCVLEPVPEDSQRTHFEIKYLARGEVCQQLTLSKPKGYRTRFDHIYLITS